MKSSLSFLRNYVLPSIGFFAAAWLASGVDWMQRIENLTLDVRTRARVKFQAAADPRIALVGIDDESLKIYDRWPWPRNVHGQLLMSLAPAKPAVVAWDILFPESDPYDMAIAMGANQLPGKVIFAAYASDDPPEPVSGPPPPDLSRPIRRVEGDDTRIYSGRSALLPVPLFRKYALTAFVDTPAEDDGVRRRVPMLVRVDQKVFPSLSLQSLLCFWGLTVDNVRVIPGDAIYIESEKVTRRIPIDEAGRYLVNFRREVGGMIAHSYGHLVTKVTEQNILKEKSEAPDLAGKILLIGQMSTGLSDNGPTPFSAETPLVLVHANVIENILREDYARRSPNWPVFLGAAGLAIVGMTSLANRKMRHRVIFDLGVPAAYIGVATWLWMGWSLWLPLVWPLLGFVAVEGFEIGRRLIAAQRAREEIKSMFGTYVSPALVNRMVESGEKPQLGGHEKEITAYFSDIQSFSTFSEKLPPDRLVELMNEYLTACTDIVQEEGGTLDKYIGDAVVAMFGAPMGLPDHAYRACVASQRVQQKLGELRAKWTDEGDKWPLVVQAMQSRIGLNSGNCVIGNMGSRTRFNYTMMGDNVNLAARMESGAKSWGAYTMCTEATKLACEKQGDRLVFRPLGRIVVKGRSEPVPIHEITGLKETVADATRECISVFTQGLERHFSRDWNGALEKFRRSAELEPRVPQRTPGVTTNPSLVYIDITLSYQREPPPPNWDGVFVMKEK